MRAIVFLCVLPLCTFMFSSHCVAEDSRRSEQDLKKSTTLNASPSQQKKMQKHSHDHFNHGTSAPHICFEKRRGFFDARHSVEIVDIRDNDGKVISSRDIQIALKNDSVVNLTPGVYKIRISCESSGASELRNLNQVNLEVKKGRHYKAVCLAAYRKNEVRHLQGYLFDKKNFEKSYLAAQQELNRRASSSRKQKERKASFSFW